LTGRDPVTYHAITLRVLFGYKAYIIHESQALSGLRVRRAGIAERLNGTARSTTMGIRNWEISGLDARLRLA